MATTWRPPADLAEQVRVAAFHLRRSVNDVLNEAVREWLAANQRKAGRDA